MIEVPKMPTGMTGKEIMELARISQGLIILEMGSWFGFSTYVLAQVVERIHAVDWHRGDTDAGPDFDSLIAYVQTIRSSKHGDRIISHIGRFEEVLPMFPDRYFDGCFVDGAHDKVSVERDISLMDRLVKDWVAFHDYGRFEVAPCVQEYAAKYDSPVTITDTLAVVRKQ